MQIRSPLEHLLSSRRRTLWVLFGGSLAIRLLFMFISDNDDGDAFARIIWSRVVVDEGIAVPTDAWLPGHFWMLAVPYTFHLDSQMWARLMTAVAGALSVPVAYLLCELLFGSVAAFLTAAVLALNPLHIRLSVVSVSEVVFILFVTLSLWTAIRFVRDGRRAHLLGGMLALNVASSLRAEAWLLLGTLPALMLVSEGVTTWPRMKTILVRSLALVVGGSAFLVGWLIFSQLTYGDPIHLLVAQAGRVANDQSYEAAGIWYRLAFWPAVLFATLGPLTLVLSGAGVARNLAGPWTRLPAILFVGLLVIYYVQNARTQLIVDARYGLLLGWLLTLNLGAAFTGRSATIGARTIAVSAVWLLAVVGLAETSLGVVSAKLRSVTPRPVYESGVREIDAWLRTTAREERVVLGPGLHRYGPWLSRLDDWHDRAQVRVAVSGDAVAKELADAGAGYLVTDRGTGVPALPESADLVAMKTAGSYVVYRWDRVHEARR